jgi:hypothetical protein
MRRGGDEEKILSYDKQKLQESQNLNQESKNPKRGAKLQDDSKSTKNQWQHPERADKKLFIHRRHPVGPPSTMIHDEQEDLMAGGSSVANGDSGRFRRPRGTLRKFTQMW